MNEEKVKEILDVYKQQTENIKEALRAAEMPEPLVALHTANLPNLDKMLPEDVLNLYKEFRRIIIIYLHRMGFTQREIVRRLGGGSLLTVNTILKESEQSEEG